MYHNIKFIETPLQKHSFSLVELLIVVSIIAMLASLMQSSLSKLSVRSKQIKCASNMSQLFMLMSSYLGDNSEAYPYGNEPTPGEASHWGNFWTYDEALGAYDGRDMAYVDDDFDYGREGEEDMPIYRCPEEEERGWRDAYRRTYVMNAGGRDSSQRGSIHYQRGIAGKKDEYTVRTASHQVGDPSGTFLMVELRHDSYGGQYDRQNVMGGGQMGYYSYANNPYEQQNKEYSNSPWHNYQWNYLFCDGSVKGIDPYDTVGENGGFGSGSEFEAQGMWTKDPGD